LAFEAFEANAATVLLRDYKSPKNEEFKALNTLYLTAVMEGFLTFNAKLVMDREPKQFCLPAQQEITAEQAAEIMMHQAKTVPDADNYPISILLLAGLADSFPCRDQTRKLSARPRGEEPAEQSQAKQATHRRHRVEPSKHLSERPRKVRASDDGFSWN
jgi:hypothetical protein